MSPKQESEERPFTVDDAVKAWTGSTAITRQQEDDKLLYEYDQNANAIKLRINDLYNHLTKLQNEIQVTNQSINFHEGEQQRLLEDFTSQRNRIEAQRADEDRTQHKWFDLQRERQDAAMSKQTNGGRSSSRDVTNQENVASGGWVSINGAASNNRKTNGRHEEDEEPPADPGNLIGAGYQPPMDELEPNGGVPLRPLGNRNHGADLDMDETELALRTKNEGGDRPLKPKQRHSLPSFSASRSPAVKPIKSETSGSDSKGRSPNSRRSLPGARSQAQSEEPIGPLDMTEINRETLILKHDGQAYTEPPIMSGVPLEKIHPQHPYWDSNNWQPLEDVMKPQLDKWRAKLENLRQTPDAVRHTVFLANRQVNRGQAVVDFLQDGEFHPYQYVGKETMEKFYKTFINYDTLFRLVNVHEELKKFELDVTPLDWLRQRMHEVSEEQGDKFNLSKYTHDLYHDRKLKALREKHGFGNIGRPSGYKVGEKTEKKPRAPRASTGGTGRRKARRSIGQVDQGEPSPVTVMDGLVQPQQSEYHEPVTPRLPKRARIEPTVQPPPPPFQPIPEPNDLEYDGYTSTDSFSAGRIMHLDWRVYQIKTPKLTTSTEVTQYWTWKPERDMFEHQVLRDVHPKVTWGYYQKPINFDLKVDEVVDIHYSPDCQKVVIHSNDKERPAILAYFKRERTRKRFLAFAKKKNVTLIRTTGAQIEEAWNSMESNPLPEEDSES